MPKLTVTQKNLISPKELATWDNAARNALDEYGYCPPDEPGAACINDWIWAVAGSLSYWCDYFHLDVDANQVAAWIRQNMTRAEKAPYEVSRMIERRFNASVEASTRNKETGVE